MPHSYYLQEMTKIGQYHKICITIVENSIMLGYHLCRH